MQIKIFSRKPGQTGHTWPEFLCYEGTIDRKPFHRGFVGNFVPHWIRYKNEKHLVRGGIDYAYMHDIDENDLHIIIE